MDSTSNEELIQAHDQLMSNPSYQTSLPIAPPPEPNRPDSSFLTDIFDAIFGFFQAIAPLLWWLLIGALVLLLCFVLFSVGRAVYERRARLNNMLKRDKPEDELAHIDVRPDEQFARSLLDDADKLALNGQYGEAIRLLLHSSISDMQERIHRRIGVSLTAREIGNLGSMPDPSRQALHAIIYSVEINVFGEQAVSKDDYDKARQHYSVFAFRGETE